MATARFYLIAGLGLILASLGGMVLYYRAKAGTREAEAKTIQTQLDAAKAINDGQAALIDRLTALREADDALLRDVRAKLTNIDERTQATVKAVSDLERSNADVKAYLGQSIPFELRCVLYPGTDGCADAPSK